MISTRFANTGVVSQPVVLADDFTDTLVMGTNKMTICFGNLFEPVSTKKKVILIPYFRDGYLFNAMLTKNSAISRNYENEIKPLLTNFSNAAKLPSYIEGIDDIIVFSYKVDEANKNFPPGEICNVLAHCLGKLDNPADYTIFIPTIGTNNGIMFYNSATSLYFDIVEMFGEHNNLDFVIMTPKTMTSEKVINHLAQLIKINRKNVHDCVICLTHKSSILLDCGHRVICHNCTTKLSNKNCPICRKIVHTLYNTDVIANANDFNCCDSPAPKTKVSKIYSCCGHYNVNCTSCDTNSKICKVCNTNNPAYIHYFDV